MDIKQNNLGAKIKILRVEAKMSQDELARKAEVPYTTLTKVETGVIKRPSVFVVSKIAEALDVSIEELIK